MVRNSHIDETAQQAKSNGEIIVNPKSSIEFDQMMDKQRSMQRDTNARSFGLKSLYTNEQSKQMSMNKTANAFSGPPLSVEDFRPMKADQAKYFGNPRHKPVIGTQVGSSLNQDANLTAYAHAHYSPFKAGKEKDIQDEVLKSKTYARYRKNDPR